MTFFTKKKLATITTPAIGTIIPKSQRQLKLSMTHPERVGPIAGASPMTSPLIPIAAPRFSGG